MRSFYLLLDGHKIGKKVKCDRVYDVAKKIFRRIFKKTNITECEFEIIEKKTKKIFSYEGKVIKLKIPKVVKIGNSGFA